MGEAVTERSLAGTWVAVAWVASRALMALLWSRKETFIDHDVRYYVWQLNHHELANALVEYPTPIALLLEVVGPLLTRWALVWAGETQRKEEG